MRISETHGVNPSMDICFFCGEPKGLVLFGKLKNDAEAPHRVLMNYEPCDKCKENMSKGVTVVEVVESDNGNLAIQDGAYPTGHWLVLKPEAAKRMFDTDAPKLLVTKEIYEMLIGGNK